MVTNILTIQVASPQVSSKSSTVRKLEVNEVLMLQSVPCKDSEIDVLRVS